jgi:hypothetical protein
MGASPSVIEIAQSRPACRGIAGRFEVRQKIIGGLQDKLDPFDSHQPYEQELGAKSRPFKVTSLLYLADSRPTHLHASDIHCAAVF